MKESAEVLKLYKCGIEQDKKMVLATVVAVDGSAYRRPGAQLLLLDDGQKAGNISAGCLEHDIMARGTEVFNLQAPLLLEYSSEEFYSLNYGCDGTIKVLVQPVLANRNTSLVALEMALEGADEVGVATIYECVDSRVFGSQLLIQHGKIVESYLGSDIAAAITSQLIKTDKDMQIDLGGIRVFYQAIKPRERLIIFGAGEDVDPVVEIAAKIGLDVCVVDGRRSYLDRYKDICAVQHFDANLDVAALLGSTAHTAVVVMSHNFELDKRFLSAVMSTNCGYIGVMGSRKRTCKILDELGIIEPPLSLRFPLGLDLGAETPAEIALSICSEILAALRNRTGHSLAEQAGPIHERASTELEGRLGTFFPVEGNSMTQESSSQLKKSIHSPVCAVVSTDE